MEEHDSSSMLRLLYICLRLSVQRKDRISQSINQVTVLSLKSKGRPKGMQKLHIIAGISCILPKLEYQLEAILPGLNCFIFSQYIPVFK